MPASFRAILPPLAFLLVAAACDSTDPEAPATALAFTVQPAAAAAGADLAPAIKVEVRTADGMVAASSTAQVTLALGANTGGVTLSGTTSVAAVNGVATFDDVTVTTVGSYVLIASSPDLTGATSASFDIRVGAAAKLGFKTGPATSTDGGVTLNAIEVAVQDAYGNQVSSSGAVTLTLGNNSNGATLSGTLVRNAVAGIAAFNDLKVDRSGTFTLNATSAPLTAATSANFTITVNFAHVSAGGTVTGGHTCALTAGGIAYCWGENQFGQLGIGSTEDRLRPALVAPSLVFAPTTPGSPLTFSRISAGSKHTCAVATVAPAAGKIFCWGGNTHGQLGDGTTTSRQTPVLVTGDTLYADVSAGDTHTCGRAQSGKVFCWGNNATGQLGDGGTVSSSSPVLVTGGRTYTALAADSAHSCAVASTNVAYCWGKNGSSELGNGGTTASNAPVQVSGGQAWSAVAVGALHSCALTGTGTPYCWGAGGNSQIGDGANANRTIATAVGGSLVATWLASGWWHNCVIGGTAGTSGGIFCWGYNANGQIGDGTKVDRAAPVAITVAGVTAFSRIDAARYHTCAVTFTGGDIYCWGSNVEGQLGDGTTFERLLPTRVSK